MKKKSMNKLLLILAMMLGIAASGAQAQELPPYKFDLGGHIGMTGYLGDANGSSIFKQPGFGAGASFRYIPNYRMAIRGTLSVMGLSGNTADFENVFPDEAQYKFNSTVYDLTCRYEFNFFPYGIGESYKNLRRWSPYLALGLGVSFASCEGKTSFAPVLPMAVGIKYKLKERLNIGLEFSMTKVFGDKVDQIDDPYKIESSFLKNTDWYSNIAISLTYEFGKRCVTCHYQD